MVNKIKLFQESSKPYFPVRAFVNNQKVEEPVSPFTVNRAAFPQQILSCDQMFDSSYNLALWLFQIINGENYREAPNGEKFSKNQQAGTNQEPEVSTIVFIWFLYWSVVHNAFIL